MGVWLLPQLDDASLLGLLPPSMGHLQHVLTVRLTPLFARKSSVPGHWSTARTKGSAIRSAHVGCIREASRVPSAYLRVDMTHRYQRPSCVPCSEHPDCVMPSALVPRTCKVSYPSFGPPLGGHPQSAVSL